MFKISFSIIFLANKVLDINRRVLKIDNIIIELILIFILSPKYLPNVSNTLKIVKTIIPDHLSLSLYFLKN